MLHNNPVDHDQVIPWGLHSLKSEFDKAAKGTDTLTRLIAAPCHINTPALLEPQFKEVAKAIAQSHLSFFTLGWADHPSRSRLSYRVDCQITKGCK